jgi:hypothetical protein
MSRIVKILCTKQKNYNSCIFVKALHYNRTASSASVAFLFRSEGPRRRPWCSLCNPIMKMKMIIFYDYDYYYYYCPFPSNGARVEWNWQGKPEELEEKPVPVPLCPPQIPLGLTLGSNPGLRGGRPAANRLSHGTAISVAVTPQVALVSLLHHKFFAATILLLPTSEISKYVTCSLTLRV